MRSERWSTECEIMQALAPASREQAGPVLYESDNVKWVYPYEGHTIFLGMSGVGKSRRCIMPMVRSLIDAEESFLIVDPKGEIHRQTVCYAKDKYDVHVINFRDICTSERINPLAYPYENFCSDNPAKKQLALEAIDDLAFSLYPSTLQTEPFWTLSARSLFTAAVYCLMSLAESPEQITLQNIYRLISLGDERADGYPLSTYLRKALEFLGEDSVAGMLLHSYVTTASDTRGGIRSEFLEGISIFARSEALVQMLSNDELQVNHLDASKPTAIYIILPDESAIYDKLCGVLIEQIATHYIRLAQDEYAGKLPRRMNIVLEELGNIGAAIPQLPHLMSAGRSRNIRCQLVLQSLSQLDKIYGSSAAITIYSNADLIVSFRVTHWDTLQELSQKCGDRYFYSSRDGYALKEALITPTQLMAMETGQALVLLGGHIKFISWLRDYCDVYDCSNWAPPEAPPLKPYVPLSNFDIREYVKKHIEKVKNTERTNDVESADDLIEMATLDFMTSDNRALLNHAVDSENEKTASEMSPSENNGFEDFDKTSITQTEGLHETIYKIRLHGTPSGIIYRPARVLTEITGCDFESAVEVIKTLSQKPVELEFNMKERAVDAMKALKRACCFVEFIVDNGNVSAKTENSEKETTPEKQEGQE